MVSPPKAGKTRTAQGDRRGDHHKRSRAAPDDGAGRRAARGGPRHPPVRPRRGRLFHLRPQRPGAHHGRGAGHRTRQARRRIWPRRLHGTRLAHPPRAGREPRQSRRGLYPLRWHRRPRRSTTGRRAFGAARNLEEGGSITILATCLVDTAAARTRSSTKSSRAPATWSCISPASFRSVASSPRWTPSSPAPAAMTS